MAEISLRAICNMDLSVMQYWRNSPKVMPYCRQYRELSYEDMVEWFTKLAKDKDYNLVNDLFMICMDCKPVGVGGFVRIDWRNRKGEISFYVAEEATKKDIAKALSHVVEYGFKTLNMHKVYFPCYQKNPNISTYEKVMKREYTAKNEYYWDGEYLDRIVLVKYNEHL